MRQGVIDAGPEEWWLLSCPVFCLLCCMSNPPGFASHDTPHLAGSRGNGTFECDDPHRVCRCACSGWMGRILGWVLMGFDSLVTSPSCPERVSVPGLGLGK